VKALNNQWVLTMP